MHEAESKRVGAFTKEELKAQPHLKDLPEETHIVTGKIVGHGDVALISDKARLGSKVIQLARRDDGGIDYQLAIFASEPTPAPNEVKEPEMSDDEKNALAYFTDKGISAESAAAQVKRFGLARVLRMREKELDAELANVGAQVQAKEAPKLPEGKEPKVQ